MTDPILNSGIKWFNMPVRRRRVLIKKWLKKSKRWKDPKSISVFELDTAIYDYIERQAAKYLKTKKDLLHPSIISDIIKRVNEIVIGP